MGLFNRDYDRNFGYRGTNRGSFSTNYDRDMGGRGESTWDSMKRNTREFFGMDNRYDQGMRGGYDRGMNNTYNRSTFTPGGQGSSNRNRGYGGTTGNAGYGGTMGGQRNTGGYGMDYAGRNSTGGYDQPYWGHDTWRYDDNYKSREQTDAGDPFGDRQSGTPIRVVDEPRDRGWFGGSSRDYDRNFRYDRDTRYGSDFTNSRRGNTGNTGSYSANPMGYDPYDNRGGDTHRLGGRGSESGFRNRNYDRDWF
jgi:hypothetical protein